MHVKEERKEVSGRSGSEDGVGGFCNSKVWVLLASMSWSWAYRKGPQSVLFVKHVHFYSADTLKRRNKLVAVRGSAAVQL